MKPITNDKIADMINVTDIKQYIYCPRIIYYTYVMPVEKKLSFKMEYGKEQHMELDRLEKRRKFVSYGFAEGKRIFHLTVASERLNLLGVIDMVIEAYNGHMKFYYPVEFKNTSGRIQLNHKYQLTAYAMLLEQWSDKPVGNGFIYIIPSKDIYSVAITQNMRDYVKRVIGAIYNIIKSESYPETRSMRRCHDCEYKNYCADLG